MSNTIQSVYIYTHIPSFDKRTNTTILHTYFLFSFYSLVQEQYSFFYRNYNGRKLAISNLRRGQDRIREDVITAYNQPYHYNPKKITAVTYITETILTVFYIVYCTFVISISILSRSFIL